ncbi:MAG: excinuclease ABC subunit UvrC [Oscillospiraceae bacterium]|nr:excinuclease ABC subunit UvrC [Oscillospiraceae bacterium]
MAQARTEKIAELRKKAMQLPLQPGVYLMHDKDGTVIYVGKAKALKNRVSQYFGSDRNHDAKVIKMVSHVDWFETIVTDSEFEALVLECSLIKQYAPKYNILLKDDKGYHYIKITKGPWSRIVSANASDLKEDGADYIGPFLSAWAVNQAVDEVTKIFQIPTCNKRFPQDIGKSRPCLNFYIKQCCAPCRGRITEKAYQERINEAVDFLKGGSSAAVKGLTEKMEAAAERLEFEKAAALRDKINAIQKVTEKQKVVSAKIAHQDVIALAQGRGSGADGCIEVFRFQDGRLYDREHFLLPETGDPKQARGEFLKRYYSLQRQVPPRISMDGEPADRELLEEWLSQLAGRKVSIVVPQRGEQSKLVEMCRNNAAEYLAQSSGRTGRETSALDELARLLGLEKPPMRIESYDISNLAGGENVAGMVVFENGRPKKSEYRKFKIKTVTGQDDYGSMAEVLTRRFQEYVQKREEGETTGFAALPDLILLDGGKGHVNAVRPVLEQFHLDIPLFGMVKDDKHRTRAIAGDGGEIAILSHRRAFTLVSDLQEEVHRFAIGYHRQQRRKKVLSSELLDIDGIGESRATALFRQFKTIDAIGNASIEELAMVPSMNRTAARKVYEHFHGEADEKVESPSSLPDEKPV